MGAGQSTEEKGAFVLKKSQRGGGRAFLKKGRGNREEKGVLASTFVKPES